MYFGNYYEVLNNSNCNWNKICGSVIQEYVFTNEECHVLEGHVNEVIEIGLKGGFKKYTVDKALLRNKYFFGEGYLYGSQINSKGKRVELLYPDGFVDLIPDWIHDKVIKPIVAADIIPSNFVNSAVINHYQPGGCIAPHIDPPHLFDRPIVSVSLFSDSCLCFGCKFEFEPIRCGEPAFRLALPRGIVTLLRGYSANQITHCVRPQDTTSRRAVIVLRRVLPTAPRISLEDLRN